MDREIQILLDERAIAAVMNEYCQAMDFAQHDRWLACFTEDAIYEVDLPHGTAYARLAGRADFERFIAAYPVLPGHRHVYVTPVFDVDPDTGTARVSAYWFVLAGGATHAGLGSLGRVRDLFLRGGDGRWRIKERRVVTEGIAVS